MNLKAIKQIQVIMFDMDGVIIDSLDFHALTYERFFKKNGANIAYTKIRSMLGSSIKDIFDNILPQEEHEEAYFKLVEFYTNDVDDLLKKIKIPSGTIDTIAKIRKKGIKTALVTNSINEVVKKIITSKNIAKLFDSIAGSDLADISKHNRCKKISNKYKIKPENILYVGDLPSDIELAKDMNYYSCLIYNEVSWLHPNVKKAKKLKSDYIINDMCSLLKIVEYHNNVYKCSDITTT